MSHTEQMREALEALAKRGTHFDVCPTRRLPSVSTPEEVDAFWSRYMADADAQVRKIARAALTAPAAEPSSAAYALRGHIKTLRLSGRNDGMVADMERAAEVLQAAPAAEVPTDGWLQEGGLLYRLTDGRRPKNRDEINVTMADGSRTPEARARRAGELLDRIRGGYPQAAAEVPEAMGDAEVDRLLPDPDGTAEANATRVELAPGVWGSEYEEVDAWSRTLIRQFASAIIAARDAQWQSTRLRGGVPEPVWIVNDLGELGVQVGDRFFFLYKGDNIEYKDAKHDDGTQMRYRIVGKREFGETCWPLSWVRRGFRADRYAVNLVYEPGLSDGKPEDGEWRDLPPAPLTAAPQAPAAALDAGVVRDAIKGIPWDCTSHPKGGWEVSVRTEQEVLPGSFDALFVRRAGK